MRVMNSLAVLAHPYSAKKLLVKLETRDLNAGDTQRAFEPFQHLKSTSQVPEYGPRLSERR